MYFNDFVSAFESADHVLVTEVYAARESLIHDFSALQIVQAMHHPDAHFVPDLAQATTFLLERLRSGDVLLVLSAGDADQISANVLLALEERKNVDARS
jgi:UDP-N-acetylmuramate--alanine ligase